MTKVSFYSLSQTRLDARLYFACRMAEKACDQALITYIHVSDSTICSQLDELMWVYQDEVFIPHTIMEPTDGPIEQDNLEAVRLGYAHTPTGQCDLLINLTDEVPPFFGRFNRMIEIIDTDEGVKEAGRKRYRWYQERGYDLDHHTM